jgi:hypothetical protein
MVVIGGAKLWEELRLWVTKAMRLMIDEMDLD